MYMSAMKGKCLNILNIYKDNLWALGDKSIEVPQIAAPPKLLEKVDETSSSALETKENAADLNDVALNMDKLDLTSRTESENQAEQRETDIQTKPDTEADDQKEEEKEEVLEEAKVDHEKVLEESFLCAVKFRSKEFKLPIIVSTFMKIMQTCW